MNLDGLIQMLLRMVIKTAVDKGIEVAARRGESEAEMTPAELEEAKRASELAGRAKDVAKVTRRLWR